MTIEEAREYWSRRLERASGYSDEHWDAEERHAHADYIDALTHAVTALAICREREETAKKPKTVRHGRWIRRETVLDVECKCSVCGYKDFVPKHDNYWFRRKFCPNCGARMDADHIADDSKKVGGADDGQIWGCNHGTSTKIRRMGEKERRADSF